MPVAMTPARLEFDAAGTAVSVDYGDVYHSADGGVGQARHVFLGGNGLPQRWRGRETFTIVETGFGLGLNFLAAWAALRDDAAGPRRLHYVSCELHPFPAGDLAAAHARWPGFAALSQELVSAWPPPLAGFHRLHLDGGRVALTLLLGDARELLPQLEARADAMFLDGFAPERNPAMWSPEVFRELARLAAPGATLASWTVAGRVRSGLAAAGFAVEKRPGFGRKRQMLTGVMPGTGAAPAAPERKAVVLGAGLAGAACAERLAARGWEVALVERHGAPGQEGSGNPAGLLRPVVNGSDAANARLSRAALGYALRQLARLGADAPGLWQPSGVLHLARDMREAERFAAIAAQLGFPPEVARFVDAGEAAAIAGRPVRGGGWHFALAGWAQPGRLCEALLARCGGRLERRFHREALRVERAAGGWQLADAAGVIAAAPVLVLANAARAAALAPGLRLRPVRGQVSVLPPDRSRVLDLPVCGDGYAVPMAGGGHCIGASFQHDDADLATRVADHAANLARAEALLPGFTAGLDPAALGGRAALRATTPDRLPYAGGLGPNEPGLLTLAGLGARGLVWAPLCAELLAARLEGEPWPLQRELAAALDPGRFLRR